MYYIFVGGGFGWVLASQELGWRLLTLIDQGDKCCERDREGAKSCAAPLVVMQTCKQHLGAALIIQHVSLIPVLVVGTCERAWSLCRGANRVLETPIEANLLACL